MKRITTTGSCNQPKSLSGIETKQLYNFEMNEWVAINLNPYQGLKHEYDGFLLFLIQVAINLNPYQGLKHVH